jgi:large subunit ribosomal protein L9
MKVILLENLENLGLPGQITNVKNGYYRNFLLPRKLAIEANDANLKSLEQKRQKLNRQAETIINEAKSVADRLKEVTLKFVERVSDNNRLFGSVAAGDIATKLEEMGFEIDRRRISMQPIKTTGTHSASIRLHANLAVPIKVIVEAENVPEPAKAEKPEAAPEAEAPAAAEEPAAE